MQSTQTFETSVVRSNSVKCLVSALSASQTFPVLCPLTDIIEVTVSPCCEEDSVWISTVQGQKFSKVYPIRLMERYAGNPQQVL